VVVDDWVSARVLAGNTAIFVYPLCLLLVFLVLAAVLFVEERRPEALYVTLTVAIVFSSGTFESAGRYVLPAFPAFAALAGLSKRRGLFAALLTLSGIAGALYVWTFVHWYWAG